VSTGPTQASQRQESYDRDAALITAQPELIWVIGDQLFANDDTAGAEERSERMKRAIEMKSPGLIQDKNQQQPDPQAVQQQAQQTQQQMQGMQQELQKTHAFAQSLHEQIQTEQVKGKLQIQLKQMDLAFQREKLASDDQNAKLKIASVEGIQELQQQIAILMDEREKSHDLQVQQAQQKHAVDTQQADQAHQVSQAQDAQAAQQQAQEQAESAQQQQGEAEQPTEGQEAA
jgi:hypothetical protein